MNPEELEEKVEELRLALNETLFNMLPCECIKIPSDALDEYFESGLLDINYKGS